MSKASKASPAHPRKEYPVVKLVIQGRHVEPVEVEVGTMMFGDQCDVSKSFFEVLAKLMFGDGGEKIIGTEAITSADLTAACIDLSVDAAAEIAARSANVSVEFLRQVDGDDALEVLAAAVNANRPFFVKSLKRFGLSAEMLKIPAGFLTPKE